MRRVRIVVTNEDGADKKIMGVSRWIQKARNPKKKGALHRQLGVPTDKNIPVTLLKLVRSAPIGKTLRNPLKVGNRRIPVTMLLKRRVQFALNVRK